MAAVSNSSSRAQVGPAVTAFLAEQTTVPEKRSQQHRAAAVCIITFEATYTTVPERHRPQQAAAATPFNLKFLTRQSGTLVA